MMEYRRCQVYLVLLCLWTPLYQGTDLCSDQKPARCCRCPQNNCSGCPDGFEVVESTEQECMIETTHGPEANATTPSVAPNESEDRNDSIFCRRCQGGFFLDNQQTTHCCHQACWTCTGKSDENCTSCMIIYNGKCVASCPDGYGELTMSEAFPTTTETTLGASSSAVSVSTPSTSSAYDNETEFDSRKKCEQSDTKPTSIYAIIAGVGGGALFAVLIVVALVYFYRRRSHDGKDITKRGSTQLIQTDVGNTLTNDNDNEEFQPDEVVCLDNIPSYKQKLNDGTNTAPSNQSDTERVELKHSDEPTPVQGGSGVQSTKTGLQEYEDVDLKNILTKQTEPVVQSPKTGLQVYATVDLEKTPTKQTDPVVQSTKPGLQEYAPVDLKNTPTKQSEPVVQSTITGLQVYDAVDLKNIPTKDTTGTLPDKKTKLEGYEDVDIKKIRTKSTGMQVNDSHLIRYTTEAGNKNEVKSEEKLYDDATVGGSVPDDNVYADT